MIIKSKALVSIVAAGAAVLGMTGSATCAFAGDASAMHTKVVSYSDLNLDTEAGAAVFYHRIEAAAGTVCASYNGRDINNKMLRQQCMDAAISASVSQVNKATVTAIHKQSAGRVS